MTPEELAKVVPLFAAWPRTDVCALAVGDSPVGETDRADLLHRSRAGEQIELTLDIVPFVQSPGVRNQKCLRFRDGMLLGFGRTGKGTPFLRDHDQRNLLARGGTIVSSAVERDEAGARTLRQRALLVEPWAVQAALTGSLDRFSIGWRPTGPVLCTACGTEALTQCRHAPGERLERGGQELVVEWEFQSAELVETSAVSVPAVGGTYVEDIRAALAAAGTALALPPTKARTVTYTRLLGRLGLSDSANEDAALTALGAVVARRDELERALSVSEASLTEASAALELERATHTELRQTVERQAEKAFVRQAIEAGKVLPGSKLEAAFRRMFSVEPDAAREQLAASPVISPVGQPRQSAAPAAPVTPVASKLSAVVRAQLLQMGVTDPDAYAAQHGEAE